MASSKEQLLQEARERARALAEAEDLIAKAEDALQQDHSVDEAGYMLDGLEQSVDRPAKGKSSFLGRALKRVGSFVRNVVDSAGKGITRAGSFLGVAPKSLNADVTSQPSDEEVSDLIRELSTNVDEGTPDKDSLLDVSGMDDNDVISDEQVAAILDEIGASSIPKDNTLSDILDPLGISLDDTDDDLSVTNSEQNVASPAKSSFFGTIFKAIGDFFSTGFRRLGEFIGVIEKEVRPLHRARSSLAESLIDAQETIDKGLIEAELALKEAESELAQAKQDEIKIKEREGLITEMEQALFESKSDALLASRKSAGNNDPLSTEDEEALWQTVSDELSIGEPSDEEDKILWANFENEIAREAMYEGLERDFKASILSKEGSNRELTTREQNQLWRQVDAEIPDTSYVFKNEEDKALFAELENSSQRDDLFDTLVAEYKAKEDVTRDLTEEEESRLWAKVDKEIPALIESPMPMDEESTALYDEMMDLLGTDNDPIVSTRAVIDRDDSAIDMSDVSEYEADGDDMLLESDVSEFTDANLVKNQRMIDRVERTVSSISKISDAALARATDDMALLDEQLVEVDLLYDEALGDVDISHEERSVLVELGVHQDESIPPSIEIGDEEVEQFIEQVKNEGGSVDATALYKGKVRGMREQAIGAKNEDVDNSLSKDSSPTLK